MVFTPEQNRALKTSIADIGTFPRDSRISPVGRSHMCGPLPIMTDGTVKRDPRIVDMSQKALDDINRSS